jgi:hypothetical protein
LIFDFNPDRLLEHIYTVAGNKFKNDAPNEQIIKTILNYYNVMCFVDNDFIKISSADLTKIIKRAKINEIVSAGFKSKNLFDNKKIENLYIENPQKLKDLVEKLSAKSGKSGETIKNNKITEHGLDVKITNSDTSENSNIKKDSNHKRFQMTKRFISCGTFTILTMPMVLNLTAVVSSFSFTYHNLNDKKFNKSLSNFYYFVSDVSS